MLCHIAILHYDSYRAKMKVWILIILLAVSSVVVSSQTCPPRHFSAVVVITVDQTVEDQAIHIGDSELHFFKKVLHFQKEEIHNIFENAINFFNYTYGLDFSDSPPNEENQRYLENALMFPYAIREDVNYIATSNRWIRNGNTQSRCYRVYEGGIAVILLNNTTLYGRYGGDEGKSAGPNEPLAYGFFSIVACQQSPVLIHYQCPMPFRTEPIDRTYVMNCYTFNRVLGRGRFQGISTVQTRPDRGGPQLHHISFTNVLTFRPDSERDGPGEREGPGERDGHGEREGPGDMEHRRMRE